MSEKQWYDDWEYTTIADGDNRQYSCTFILPHIKAGPKKIVITDHHIANILLSALDWITNAPKSTDSPPK